VERILLPTNYVAVEQHQRIKIQQTAYSCSCKPIDGANDGPKQLHQQMQYVTAVNALTNDTLAGIAATTANTNVTPLTMDH
jgi:hypothetical protein